MLLMPTVVLFDWILTSVKFGMILVLYTNHATTKYKMLLTLTNVLLNLIHPIHISSNVWNYFVNLNQCNLHKGNVSGSWWMELEIYWLLWYRVGSAPAPRDVSNPNQYQNNPGTQPLNGGYNQVCYSLWCKRKYLNVIIGSRTSIIKHVIILW